MFPLYTTTKFSRYLSMQIILLLKMFLQKTTNQAINMSEFF